LLLCISMIDWVVATIRASESRAEARVALAEHFTPEQTEYILDLQLGRITRLGNKDLEQEARGLSKQIVDLKKILGSTRALNNLLIKELNECVSNEPRRSELGGTDLVAAKKVTKQESTMRVFSSTGRVHQGAQSLEIGETLVASLDLAGATDVGFITTGGMFKKTSVQEIMGVSRKVFPAIKLRDGDSVAEVLLDPETIPIKTKTGRTKHFDAKKVRSTGRTSIGVILR